MIDYRYTAFTGIGFDRFGNLMIEFLYSPLEGIQNVYMVPFESVLMTRTDLKEKTDFIDIPPDLEFAKENIEEILTEACKRYPKLYTLPIAHA